MAIPGYVTTLLGGLSADVKATLVRVFDYVLPNNKFGPIDHQTKSESFQGYWLMSTTAASTATEFSIVHGMGRTPYLAIAAVRLDSTGMFFPRLKVTRAADGRRVYFRSEDTNAIFSVLVE